MRSFITIALLAAVASTQSIDPSTVPVATRKAWCVSQKASCPLLCTQENDAGNSGTSSNTCDATTLDWSCVCIDGVTPNVTEYSLTIPYFECTEFNTQCVNGCGGNSACQASCRDDHPCGAQDPVRVNSTSASPTATKSGASGSGTAAATTGFDSFGGGGSGSSQATSTSKSNSAMRMSALNLGQTYGLAVVGAGIFAGFGLML